MKKICQAVFNQKFNVPLFLNLKKFFVSNRVNNPKKNNIVPNIKLHLRDTKSCTIN